MLDDGPSPIHLWVNPPQTSLPVRESPLRVAVGTPTGPSTNSWRVWLHGNDVYVQCRDNFRELKASLHASGIWRVGFTQEFVDVRPDIVPAGHDRAWKKWRPDLTDPTRPVVGFQLVALKQALYLGPKERQSWPTSVVFVEPPANAARMTVVSVSVVQSLAPLLFAEGTHGAVVAILPLGPDRTVQLVATHENPGEIAGVIEDAFGRSVGQVGGLDQLPNQGVFFVLGDRGEGIPWVTAVPFHRKE